MKFHHKLGWFLIASLILLGCWLGMAADTVGTDCNFGTPADQRACHLLEQK